MANLEKRQKVYGVDANLQLLQSSKKTEKAKMRDWQMHGCTHLSRFALVSRVFPGRYAKKYTGFCIIACVPMWLRGEDLNQRPPGYEPDELPAALPRDIFFSLDNIAHDTSLVKAFFRRDPKSLLRGVSARL